jgi:hypothetical protein
MLKPMRTLEDTVAKLCDASRRKAVDPYTHLDWPEKLDPDQWCTSPELVSLHGTPRWEQLDEAARKRLSFLEAVNFCSINIHGEKVLIEGLAQRLYSTSESAYATSSPYLHHFIDEENKHLVYFGGFCSRYAGKVYPDRKIDFPRKYAPGEDEFLFFARVLVFEEIVDAYNQRNAADDRLAPIARAINHAHHLDESRHLAFGRQIVRELFQSRAPEWSRQTLEGVRKYLSAYFVATWREYYNPDVYTDLDVEDPYELADVAFRDEGQRARRREMSAGLVRYFLENEILAREPAV